MCVVPSKIAFFSTFPWKRIVDENHNNDENAQSCRCRPDFSLRAAFFFFFWGICVDKERNIDFKDSI